MIPSMQSVLSYVKLAIVFVVLCLCGLVVSACLSLSASHNCYYQRLIDGKCLFVNHLRKEIEVMVWNGIYSLHAG